MLKLPEVFIQKMTGAFGQEGEAFLDGLEEKIETISKQWELTIEGHFDNLSYNYVAKAANRDGKPVILKLGVANFDFTNEINTIRSYDGEGCAMLLMDDAELGAMLLESLQPGTMLSELNEEEAIAQYAMVWKAIRRLVPADWPSPSILNWATGLDRYLETFHDSEGPFPVEMVKRAQEFFKDLTESQQAIELLHGDLHHENILFSEERGWTAIDPKGVTGDRYFDLTSFLTNHLFEKENPRNILEYRIERLASILELDKDRFLKASFAMAMLYACWGVEDQDNEGAMNTFQVAGWLDELISVNSL